MIQVSAKMRIKLPDLDFTQTFQEIARDIICPDMRGGINRGIGIDNAPFPALEPATVASKAGARKRAQKAGTLTQAGLAGGRKGTQTLVDQGILRESFEYETVSKNHIRIFVGALRANVAKYLQIDGVGNKKKKFNFFGISQRAELQAIAKMKGKLREALARSNNGG
jgi:hypothetical protein